MPIRAASNNVSVWYDIEPDPRIYEYELLRAAAYLEDTLTPLMEAKAIAREDMKDHFHGEVDPDGIPWEPLNPEYLTSKISQGYPPNILYRTGDLYNTATDEEAWVITGRSLFFSSAGLPAYGMWHQSGTEEMPARPFIGLSREAEAEILALFDAWAGGAIIEEPPIRGLGLTSYTGAPMSLGQMYVRGPYGHIYERGAMGRITGRVSGLGI